MKPNLRKVLIRGGRQGHLTALGALASLMLLSACGGQAYRTGEASGTSSGGTSVSGGSSFGGGSSSGSGSSNSSGSGTTTPPAEESFLPARSESFTVTGSGGTSPTFTASNVRTDSLLKVKVIAGAAGPVSIPSGTPGYGGSYSNYQASYGCVRYTIEVAGRSVTTNTLAVEGQNSLCPDAPTSQIIDFSDRAVGVTNTSVKVTAVRYDYYCQLVYMGYISPYYYNTYCGSSLYSVYRTHSVTGTLEIQTNGTQFSE
jgi:hypothetical protein